MRSVYILLTRPNTVFSKVIHGVTRDAYSHASLALDRELTRLYSFGRKVANQPLNAGFVRECLGDGVFARCPDAPAALYEIRISEAAYVKLRLYLAGMLDRKECYRYNYLGAAACFFHHSHTSKTRFFCSEFVAQTLTQAGAIQLRSVPSQTLPCDFARLPEAKLIYRGRLGGAGRTHYNINCG